MLSSEEYRRRAAEARRTADHPDTPPALREQYLKVAREWEALAREVQPKPKPGRW